MDLEFLRPEIIHEDLPWLAEHDEGELAVDVYETDKAVVVKTAIAGIKPEELSLSFSGDMLTIRGERHEEETHKDRHYLSRECHWGAFSRSIILPSEVNTPKADAVFKNGVLTIILPKSKGKSNKIKVKVEGE